MHPWLRGLLVYVLGVGLIVFGILGLFLPLHPGLVVIALGLGVLSLEARWARRARRAFLDWLADRDVDSQRLRRWQRRLHERFPAKDEEEASEEDERENAQPAADGGER